MEQIWLLEISLTDEFAVYVRVHWCLTNNQHLLLPDSDRLFTKWFQYSSVPVTGVEAITMYELSYFL